MKLLLLAACLFAAAPVMGQTVSAPGTTEALDVKNGFRGYKLGTPIAEIQGLKPKGKGLYTAPSEPLKIGEARLMGLYFIATNEKLSAILFTAFKAENCRKVLDALQAQYGTGKQVSATRIEWAGQSVSMTYELKTSYPTYVGRYSQTTGYQSCEVYIVDNSAVAAVQQAKEEAAKKAASDL